MTFLASVCMVVGIVYIGMVQGFTTENRTLNEQMIDLNTGWADEAGNEITLPCSVVDANGDGQVILSRKMEASDAAVSLVIEDNHLGLHVSQDGIRVFTINEDERSYVRISNTFVATLQESDRAYRVDVVFSGFAGDSCAVPAIKSGPNSATALYVVTDTMATTIFTLGLLVILFMVLVASVYIAVSRKYDMRLGLVGGIVAAAAIWGFADSPISSISGLDLVLCAYLCYYSLMALPILTVAFVMRTCNRQYKSLHGVFLLCLLNVIAQSGLTFSGTIPMSSMVFVTHSLILLGALVSIRCLVISRRETEGRVEKVIISSLQVFAGIIILALITYWFDIASSYRALTLGGITIFVFVLMYALIVNYMIGIQSAAESAASAQHYAELASIDELTGLANRRAFDAHVDRIEANAEKLPNALLTFFDLNGLKYMNDTYGHAAGDKLIELAGICIEKAYGEEGECYRIGGDEFAAVIDAPAKEPSAYSAALDEAIASTNVDMPHELSISRGWCVLSNREGELLSVSDWKLIADVRMYDDKAASGIAR